VLRGRTGRRVGGCEVEQCIVTVPVRADRPRVPPAGVLAWHGELESCVSLRGSSSAGAAPRSCGPPDPVLQPPSVGPALVRDGNYSCERVVGGGDSSCEQVVGAVTESPRARQKSSCKAETCRARRRLLERSGDLSGRMPTSRRWGVLLVRLLTKIRILLYPGS
jgi:hypothetical protein